MRLLYQVLSTFRGKMQKSLAWAMAFSVALWVAGCAAAPSAPPAWRLHWIDRDDENGSDGTEITDMDGDGDLDITGGFEEGGDVRLYINGGDGKNWARNRICAGACYGVEDTTNADLNCDGLIDVISAEENDPHHPGGNALRIHWNPGNLLGSWRTQVIPASQSPALNTEWMVVVASDVDKDGDVDLIAGSKHELNQPRGDAGLYWFKSPGCADAAHPTAWQVQKVTVADWIMGLRLRDMDRDGDFDIVASDRAGLFEPPQHVDWYENRLADGAGWVQHPVGRGGNAYWFALHDTDADGDVDVIAAGLSAAAQIYRNPGQPQRSVELWPSTQICNSTDFGGEKSKSIAVGDIDGDGVNELVMTSLLGEAEAPRPVTLYELKAKPAPACSDYKGQILLIMHPAKFDEVHLVDMDRDDDLDVVSNSEYRGGGIFWLENPLY